jgi:enoyl-CoA hydratase/carnithine racemase
MRARWHNRPMALHIEHDGPVASLVIDRPDRHNAFTDEMWSNLPPMLSDVAERSDVRVLVVRSASDRVFSAGADVEDLKRAIEDPSRADRGLAVIQAAFQALIDFPKPTIAMIRGACHGGGVGLSVCCDLRLADTTAVFSIPPARLGLLYPYPALQRLVWMIGPGMAKLLLFSARRFDATTARDIGFLDELHSPDALGGAVAALASEIAANGPEAIVAMKRVVALTERADSQSSAIARELELAAITGPEHAEGVTAFLEKRRPEF